MDIKIVMPCHEYYANSPNGTNYLANRICPKKKKVKLPKSLITFFLVLQFCFGVDAGFSNVFEGKKRKIIKYLCCLVSLTIILILISPVIIWYREVWMWCTLLKYTIDFINMKLTKYKTFDFLNDVHELNENIPAIDKELFGRIMLIYTITMYVSKAFLGLVRCAVGKSIYCHRVSLTFYTIFCLSCLSTDTISGILIVIVYYVYSYIKHVKNCLQTDFDLKAFEMRYIAIAQCCTKIRKVFNYIIIVELFINTPRLMVTLWCMLVYIKENAAWYSYTTEWLFAFHLTIQMCIPAVIGEMVNCQMDSIKLMLNEQRMKERDREKVEEITRIMRYIKVRRLQNEIWHVIPLDLRLPLALLSLCTTYFIVILQFTHLYD